MTPTITFPPMDEFLRRNPLPKRLRHLEPSIRKLSVDIFLRVVINGVAIGCTSDEIDEGVRLAAEFAEQKEHRCAACLRWSDEYHALATAGAGGYRFFAVCVRCQERIEQGTATRQMQRNLLSYGLGEVQS